MLIWYTGETSFVGRSAGYYCSYFR